MMTAMRLERSSRACPQDWGGPSPHTKGAKHCEPLRNILKAEMVLVLLQCCILEILAHYQIIKHLMKFKTYNTTSINSEI